MRIALVTTFPPGKGSLNEYAYHFVRHLRTKAEVDEVIILADELPSGETYDDLPANMEDGLCPLHIRVAWRFGDMRNPLRIRQAIRDTSPDVVLFNLQFASFADQRVPAALGLLSPAMAKSTETLSTILLHNIMETVDLGRAGFGGNPIIESITRLFGDIFTRFLLQADMIAVTIPKYVDILTSKYEAEHVVLAPHGAFEEIPEPSGKLPDGPMQVMTFGKFGTYKTIESLIEAFAILQKRLDTPLELVIAGTDSPNTPGYLAGVQARYQGIGQVRYTGYVAEEDVPQTFQDAAVVAFPYNSTTGSSGVLHQAGSYGKAVVLPNLGDFAELVQDEGYTGEFFEPDDANSLADAIERLVTDRARRRAVERQNYVAAAGLPMSEVVDWYLLHFERLLQGRNTRGD